MSLDNISGSVSYKYFNILIEDYVNPPSSKPQTDFGLKYMHKN